MVYTPPTGLMGSEQALNQGLQGALSTLMLGAEAVDPYARTGASANNLQAALSGALGPEAQREAFANYNASPGQEFFRDEQEQALLRNEAALGGLGGGRVREELQRQAFGNAAQNYQNDFNNLNILSQIGLGAAGTQAGLSQNGAGLIYNTGLNKASGRTRAGELIAANESGVASALADLINQQGGGISSIVGNATGNVADIIANAGINQGQSTQNLANILANIGTGSASQVASLPGLPSLQSKPGVLNQVGQLASGVGSVMGAL